MKRPLRNKIALFLALGAVFLFILMTLKIPNILERHFLYFPDRVFSGSPADIGLEFEDVYFGDDKRKLHGWWIPHPKPSAVILFFHGNAGNISHRLEKIKMFHEIGASTFIIDYSGYGKSEGTPSEKILYQDGMVAHDALKEKGLSGETKIILYGESLGCAVAIDTAASKPVHGLILESPFLSLKAIANVHFPVLSPLAGDQFDNIGKIGSVQGHKLFIHSRPDEIVPFEQGEKLFEAAPTPKEHLWLDQGGHNDAFWINKDLYLKTLKDFLARH